MSVKRNLRRTVLGLVCVASVLALAAGVRLHDSDSKEGTALEAQPKEIPIEEKGEVAPGTSSEIDLAAETGHRYSFRLEAGQFTQVVVDQRGIDVKLKLVRPNGKGGEVDSPNGTKGPEILYEIAETAGDYRLDVVADEPSAPGKYTIEMSQPVPATPEHHQRIAAWRIFRKGEKSRQDRDFKEALVRYQKALPLWNQLGDRGWEGETLYRIGWVHQELGEPKKAIEFLQAALPFFEDKASWEHATIRNRIGNCFLQRSELAEAKAELEKALTVARESGDATIEAGVLISLGHVHNSMGESQKAQDFFREGLGRAREAKDVTEEGKALSGLGDLLVYQGKLREGQDALERALQINRDAEEEAQVRFILRRLANIDQRLDRRDDALRRLEEALELARRAGDRESEATTLNSLGTVHLLGGDTQKAGEAYGRGLELFRERGNPHGEAFALLNLGRYHRSRGEHPAALERFGQSVEVFRRIGLRRGEISAMYGAAQVLHDAKDYRAAEERLRSVTGLLGDLRRESESQDLRASFLATKQHYNELYIDVLMHLHEEQPSAGYDVRALETNETLTARSLLELLGAPRVRGTLGQEEADLVRREQELLKNIQAAERELLDAREKGEEANELASRQRDLLAELDAVQTRLRQNGSAQLDVVRPRPATLEEMRAELRGGTRLIVYALGEERSFVWCVSRTSMVSKALPARSHLEGTAQQLLRGWSQRGERSMERERRWAESLGRDLLGPIAGELGQHRLLIIGDGALQTLPFAALPDPRAKRANDGEIPPLLMAHEIVQMQSVSVLSALRRRTKGDPPLWGAMIADPVFGGGDDERLRISTGGRAPAGVPLTEGSSLERTARNLGIHFDRLVYTGDEAKAIRELLGDEMEPFLGFDANREKLLAEDLRKYKILHFATHGLVDPEHSEVAGLVLSLVNEKGEPQEGFLLAQEIGNLDLWADLVVLSACQTGLGKEVRGEGPIGLTRSFFCAGAPRVVVSLWNVNDRATAELMKRFYRGMIRENLPPAAALRCAQLSMRQGHKDWRDPYIWAPFIFQGDWDDLVRTGGGPIEKRSTGTGTGTLPDDDLPGGPGSGGPRRCPDLI